MAMPVTRVLTCRYNSLKHERIQSERAGLGADSKQTLHRVERNGRGLERESMAESLKKGAKREISTVIIRSVQCE
jgi:hypothetical protein